MLYISCRTKIVIHKPREKREQDECITLSPAAPQKLHCNSRASSESDSETPLEAEVVATMASTKLKSTNNKKVNEVYNQIHNHYISLINSLVVYRTIEIIGV